MTVLRCRIAGSADVLCRALTMATALPALAAPQQLAYGDGVPAGKLAHGGGGHVIAFDAGAEGRWLTKLEVLGARYGQEDAGQRRFSVTLLTMDGETIARVTLPWSLFETGECYWRDIPMPSLRVPSRFAIRLDSGSEPGNGIHVGYDQVPQSHSCSCATGLAPTGLGNRDWMAWVTLDDAPVTPPTCTDLVVLADGQAFFDTVLGIDAEAGVVRSAVHGAIPVASIAELRLRAVEKPTPTSVVLSMLDGTQLAGALRSMDADVVRLQDFAGAEKEVPRADVRGLTIARSTSFAIPAQAPAPDAGDAGLLVAEKRRWGPEQATGPPDTPEEGDRVTAWAPLDSDGGAEWLETGYLEEVQVAEVRVIETCGPGAVTKVVAVDADGNETGLWEGKDPTTEAPGELVVRPAQPVLTRCIRVYLDTAAVPSWNEIDAVELVGTDGARQWATEATASSTYADRTGQRPTFEWLGPPDTTSRPFGGDVGLLEEVTFPLRSMP